MLNFTSWAQADVSGPGSLSKLGLTFSAMAHFLSLGLLFSLAHFFEPGLTFVRLALAYFLSSVFNLFQRILIIISFFV